MGSQRTWLVVLLVALYSCAIIESLQIAPETENDVKPADKKIKLPKIPLAEDPRFNKMLPVTNQLKDDVKDAKKTDAIDDEYNYDYEEDDYDEDDNESDEQLIKVPTEKSKTKTPVIGKLKPIKGNDQDVPKKDAADHYIDEDEDEDDEDDDEYDDIPIKGEILYNENVPCPRDCVCDRNLNSYMVATCSRLDAAVQSFSSDITDLVVVDVGPKYPIYLGPEFFVKIGLKHVSSIKIANCTIEHLDKAAFNGLDVLYSVNLTSVGLTSFNPDTFAELKKLRILTISGNDLSSMLNEKYLIKSNNLEEIDLSRNNLHDLRATAFNELLSITYINLSQNNIKQLHAGLFNNVATIEELDLSKNSLTSLPPAIFNRTTLAILYLKYNDLSNNLAFGTSDLQTLDLSYNNIKKIHHGMFDKMDGLTNLNLKGNGITKIAPDSFLSLVRLRHIDLSVNQLDQVSGLMFYKNTELNVIRLNDNARLTELPPDGFKSASGDFTVYLLDLSSCAISSLGEQSFLTMPDLVTLRLAWNNINNLDKNTFNYLRKLTDLDLSNNLISRLDNMTFSHNHGITKLNLAGNAIRKLSASLFSPFEKLRTLDVSECELTTILHDIRSINVSDMHKYRFFETLRFINASFNQIKRLSKVDVDSFKSLNTIDFTNNPIKCNDDFKGLIKYLTKMNIYPGKVESMANLDEDFAADTHPLLKWELVAKNICKHSLDAFKPKEKTIEQIRKDILKESNINITKLLLGSDEKNPKKKDDKKKEEEKKDEDESDEEEDDESYGDYYSEDDNNEEEDDDDEEEDEKDIVDLKETKDNNEVHIPIVKDHGLFVEDINILKETNNVFLREKLFPKVDDDEDEDGTDTEEDIIIERGRLYYNGYRFIFPLLTILSAVVILLFAMSKIISVMMRKRGERYKMAILSSKNCTVYQKLSEDLPKPQKNPKKHIYAPIEQV